jgi:hypothetical protein
MVSSLLFYNADFYHDGLDIATSLAVSKVKLSASRVLGVTTM